mmetsp:Transcript_17377/g.31882  ORF Transcript_17377/g.31882 Transcript_17377/m.31882 type:complete len:359 (-) Transcript_17377:111-1187(-)
MSTRRPTMSRASIKLVRKGKPEQTALTGDLEIDAAIKRYREAEESTKAVTKAVEEYFGKVREVGDRSNAMGTALLSYFVGSHSEDRARAYYDMNEKIGLDIPNKLLATAKKHILDELETLNQKIANVKDEISTFNERQKDYDHYKTKIDKMEEEKRKRQTMGKIEKPKEIEKHTRNMKKLAEAKAARDEMVTALLNRLNFLYETRATSMEPIMKYLHLFQQELCKQSGEQLMQKLPELGASSSNTTTPIVPVASQSEYLFDANGNRVLATKTVSSAPQLPPSSHRPLPTPPPPPQSSPAQPVSHRAATGQENNVFQNHVALGTREPISYRSDPFSSPAATKQPVAAKDDALVDKWFSE